MVNVIKQSENMRKMETLKQNDSILEDGCLTSTLMKSHPNNQQFATVVYPQSSKETIWSGRSSLCENNFIMQKSSRILDLDLTTKEKGLTPFWNDFCKEKSLQLWLPTKTGLQGLEQNLSSSLSSKMVENSWFSTNWYIPPKESLPKIYSPFSQYFHVECMDLEDIKSKSKKIRIYPNQNQKSIFKNWFGAARFSFNQAFAYLKNPETKANWMSIKGELLEALPEWSNKIPYQIKSIAIKDACTSVLNAKKKFAITHEFQDVSYKSRKDTKQSCYIPKSAISELGIYHSKIGELKFTENIPDNWCDSRLTKENGRYYVCIPHKVQLPSICDNQANRVVALDPGVRTFITFFSENSCGKIGEGCFKRIFNLCLKIDKLLSSLSKEKLFFKRCRIKSLIGRTKWKIKDLISELHFKTANFLVKNFDIILLPTFEVSDMVDKSKRKISSRTARNMLSLSHYKFKQIIKFVANNNHKFVIDVNEAYTSKTVSWTGEIIENLNGNRVIKSNFDGQVMDRDYNGARGIFLRALRGDTP